MGLRMKLHKFLERIAPISPLRPYERHLSRLSRLAAPERDHAVTASVDIAGANPSTLFVSWSEPLARVISARMFGGAEDDDLVDFGQAAGWRDTEPAVGRQVPRRPHQRAGVGFGRGAVRTGHHDGGEPRERRQMRIFTREDFFRIEFLLIARDQGADDGMVGLAGLDQPPPRPVDAPGATHDLLQQLERAFGRTRIAE